MWTVRPALVRNALAIVAEFRRPECTSGSSNFIQVMHNPVSDHVRTERGLFNHENTVFQR